MSALRDSTNDVKDC